MGLRDWAVGETLRTYLRPPSGYRERYSDAELQKDTPRTPFYQRIPRDYGQIGTTGYTQENWNDRKVTLIREQNLQKNGGGRRWMFEIFVYLLEKPEEVVPFAESLRMGWLGFQGWDARPLAEDATATLKSGFLLRKKNTLIRLDLKFFKAGDRGEHRQGGLGGRAFCAAFSLQRMTWIKPSFLWMMQRCGWGQKSEQEWVLAVHIRRSEFEKALARAVLTSPESSVYRDAQEWSELREASPVLVQWDPEYSLRGVKLNHRSLQVGLGRGSSRNTRRVGHPTGRYATAGLQNSRFAPARPVERGAAPFAGRKALSTGGRNRPAHRAFWSLSLPRAAH